MAASDKYIQDKIEAYLENNRMQSIGDIRTGIGYNDHSYRDVIDALKDMEKVGVVYSPKYSYSRLYNLVKYKRSNNNLEADRVKTIMDKYLRDKYNTNKVINEFSVSPWGGGLIDIAVIEHNKIHGIEIKSSRDQMSRLRDQVPKYEAVCHMLTIVTPEKKLKTARKYIGDHWGLITYNDNFDLSCIREPDLNPNYSAKSLLEILWSKETSMLMGMMLEEKYKYILDTFKADEINKSCMRCINSRFEDNHLYLTKKMIKGN